MAIRQSELIKCYIEGELVKLANYEKIPVIEVTIDPLEYNPESPISGYIYTFYRSDKFPLSFYYSDSTWHCNIRSSCKQNKDLLNMMKKYFPDGRVTKDAVKDLLSSEYFKRERSKLNFSERLMKLFN